MDDPYLEIIDKQWSNILMVYRQFEINKPIIEYDICDHKIYAWPGKDYIKSLTKRTKSIMKKQYQESVKNDKLILFIKDSENEILRSYVYSLEERLSS